ncbi:hypothetical protein ACJW30_03G201600 [Castanea mollissima]
MDEYVGNGVLKGLLPKLVEEGWGDVPTLKIMNSEDMNELNMTQQQKDALEIRSYLHDRGLIQYGDEIESDGRCLSELLNLGHEELSSQFGMKRGHIARFMDRTSSCADLLPEPHAFPPPNKISMPSRNNSRVYKTLDSRNIKDGYMFKGIVGAEPAEPRVCGCVKPPPIVDTVAPYSAIESISIQKLTPEYKLGTELLVKTKTPPMKASELWRDKPAVLLCIRRPGCIMCRVKDFWPRYWGGALLFDRGMEFFEHSYVPGGGKLLKEKFLSGFVFNPRAIANYKRAKAMGMIEQNFRGEGEVKGGLFILGSGKSGIAYQFIERNFGDKMIAFHIINQLFINVKLMQNQPQD